MGDLVAFLRARLDEDEAVADAASGPEWGDVSPTQPFTVFDVAAYRNNKTLRTAGAIAGVERAEDRVHIARHDPARVLREVEAKRALLDEYASVAVNDLPEGGYEYATGWANGLGLAVRYAAAAYADHPDYRPEWAPTA